MRDIHVEARHERRTGRYIVWCSTGNCRYVCTVYDWMSARSVKTAHHSHHVDEVPTTLRRVVLDEVSSNGA